MKKYILTNDDKKSFFFTGTQGEYFSTTIDNMKFLIKLFNKVKGLRDVHVEKLVEVNNGIADLVNGKKCKDFEFYVPKLEIVCADYQGIEQLGVLREEIVGKDADEYIDGKKIREIAGVMTDEIVRTCIRLFGVSYIDQPTGLDGSYDADQIENYFLRDKQLINLDPINLTFIIEDIARNSILCSMLSSGISDFLKKCVAIFEDMGLKISYKLLEETLVRLLPSSTNSNPAKREIYKEIDPKNVFVNLSSDFFALLKNVSDISLEITAEKNKVVLELNRMFGKQPLLHQEFSVNNGQLKNDINLWSKGRKKENKTELIELQIKIFSGLYDIGSKA